MPRGRGVDIALAYLDRGMSSVCSPREETGPRELTKRFPVVWQGRRRSSARAASIRSARRFVPGANRKYPFAPVIANNALTDDVTGQRDV